MKTAFAVAVLALGGLSTTAALASPQLAASNACIACHAVDTKLLGPSYKDVAEKYRGDDGAAEYLYGKIKQGGSGVWGQIPMPPHGHVSDEDVTALVSWILEM